MNDTASDCVYDIPTPLSYGDYMKPERARLRARQHFKGNKHQVVGPMSPSVFMDKFCPVNELNSPNAFHRLSSRGAFNSIPAHAETSAEIFTPLAVALNKSTKHKSRCPGFTFDIAATRTLRQDRRGYMKPHICCYTPSNSETVRAAEVSSRIDLGYAEFFIHVSPDPSRDFFSDPPSDLADRSMHEFLSSSSSHRRQRYIEDVFGQHMSYVAEVFTRQPRIFVFSASLHGSRARLFFWDRAGCVVSESFDIRKDPDILCEFLWRFSNRGDIGRGHDVTVQPALPEEEELFRDALRLYAATQIGEGEDLEEEVNRHYAPGQIYATSILHQGFSSCDDNTRRYVFSRPVVCSNELSPHGTRGYWAVDVATETIVFLKDTWRELTSKTEGDILRRLYDLGVRNIPSLVWQGDVPWVVRSADTRRTLLQTTLTNRHDTSSWRCPVDGTLSDVATRRHYRLILGTAGRPFSTVRGTKELLHASHDVFSAMRDALEKDSRVHRDISTGNIVLVTEEGTDVRKGILIDWELSCTVDDDGNAEVYGRAGTWRFMSIRILDWAEPDEERHRFQDDMESLLWVVLYGALMWQPHNYSDDTLRDVMRDFFDSRIWLPLMKTYRGGVAKNLHALNRGALPDLRFDSGSLQQWFSMMMAYLSPLPTHAKKPKDKWTDHGFIHQFWTEFLDTPTLETANRVEHTPTDNTRASDVSSRVASEQWKTPPFPKYPGVERTLSRSPSPARRASTRKRVLSTPPASQSRPNIPDSALGTLPPRRSERLRDRPTSGGVRTRARKRSARQ
ncbi:uncharacterized protein BXZ73DRAFT_46678 [Epithele typhae]|uniref:uncharacterized protein n=1 Tax=Epithele typhae TaxID=378194 RepID=UPI0020076A6B|nr:uncharacterized protein BXZ73DRAFT_46678 [Epithele typhae]KAH9932692.1 hypothetical protein BXZ73DRAFT_46678 [Epithele typhae]